MKGIYLVSELLPLLQPFSLTTYYYIHCSLV